MHALRRRPVVTVTALSLLAFLVVGGSALARGSHRAATAPAYQKKCANGAVKAIVLVVADQNKGFQSQYTADPTFFKTRWSCNPKAVFQARRVDRGVYDVRVAGMLGATPLVTPIGGPVKVGTTALADGGFEVRLLGVNGSTDYAVDESFVLVLL